MVSDYTISISQKDTDHILKIYFIIINLISGSYINTKCIPVCAAMVNILQLWTHFLHLITINPTNLTFSMHTYTTYIVIGNALAVNTFIHHLSHVTLNVQQNNPIFGLGIIKNTCKSKNRIWHHCVLCLSLKITEITFQELFPFTCQHVDF